MSIHEIQLFLEKLESGSVGVDLVKIGLNYAQSVPNTARKYGNNKFRVALDIEQCLDRFYGGYYSGNFYFLFLPYCRCIIIFYLIILFNQIGRVVDSGIGLYSSFNY